jgi:hypothetical protein
MRRTALLMALAGSLSACGADDDRSPSPGDTAPQKLSQRAALEQRLNDACQAPVTDVAVAATGYYTAREYDRYVVVCQNGSVRVVDDR